MAPKVQTEFFENDTPFDPSSGRAGLNLAGAETTTQALRKLDQNGYGQVIRDSPACVPPTNFCEKFDQNSFLEKLAKISSLYPNWSGIMDSYVLAKANFLHCVSSILTDCITICNTRCIWPPNHKGDLNEI